MPCFAAATLTLFMGSAMAGSTINRANEGPAIEGYDTVAYHTKGQPQKGDAKYSSEWNGAKWQFATEENLQKPSRSTRNVTRRSTAAIAPTRWPITALPMATPIAGKWLTASST